MTERKKFSKDAKNFKLSVAITAIGATLATEGAIYLTKKYGKPTVEFAANALDLYRNGNKRKETFASLPEKIQNDIWNGDEFIKNESEFLTEKNPELFSSNLMYDDEVGLSEQKITVISYEDEESEEETTTYKIIMCLEDLPEFTNGMAVGAYVIKNKLEAEGGNLPYFSTELMSRYNYDLLKHVEKSHEPKEVDIAEHLASEDNIIKDQELSILSKKIISCLGGDSPMLTKGAFYMIGLYESKKELDRLEEDFNHPEA
jgi:hypothetical protein